MRMKLVDQSPRGILNSLIARLLLEHQREGLAVLLDALRYLNDAANIGC